MISRMIDIYYNYRGGCWVSSEASLIVDARLWYGPFDFSDYRGFRLVRRCK